MAQKQTPMEGKIQRLARAYVPEWRFSIEQPDAGSVVGMLVGDMLSQSQERFGKVLHKHKIQYLNLFDSLKEEPIESAKSYVRFTQVAGMDDPVPVPKGTRLLAENPSGGQRLVFETEYGITTTPAQLQVVCATDRDSDRIVTLAEGGFETEELRFSAFDLSNENLAEHVLYLGFDTAFDALNTLQLGLRVETADPDDLDRVLEALTSQDIHYSILEQEGEKPFDQVERQGDLIWLTMKEYIPEKVELEGQQRYVLAVRSNTPREIRISSLSLCFAQKDLPADEVIAAGVTQSVGRFFPFGSPMEIFAECGIENRGVFARRGAQVEMSFDLEFDTIEQQLPQIEDELDYKVVMRKPVDAPKLEAVEIWPDYVLVEYLSTRGWKRLLEEEHAALLFNGSGGKEITLRFAMPQDMEQEGAGDYRLRLRLMRADNLYRIPCIQHCPVIQNLRFSYTYEEKGLRPDYAVTHNNFSKERVDPQFLSPGHDVLLFYTQESSRTAMYLGFDQSPQGMPLSLYFEVENDEDMPLDYTVEYSGRRGFETVTPVDHTGGLLYSGAMLLPIGSDTVPLDLFGHTCYWLRLSLKSSPPAVLPVIRRIYTNMARVENARTRSEVFFFSEENMTEIQLSETGLLTARVWVNEENNNPQQEENWVEWKPRVGLEQRGRYYTIDLAAGRVTFERNAFAPYPIKPGGPSVRVDYQSYQGAQANVPKETITTTEESVRYISSVTNPMAAYGGYDGYNEETSAAIISNMLRTRGRAVTGQDYFDIISQVSYGVRRIKCLSGVNRQGVREDDVITVALLIDEYDKGSHIFSAVKDTIRQKLVSSSNILPLGKTLVLCQPHFVRFSARIWLDCRDLEEAYDRQQQTLEDMKRFIDPLEGGFDGKGWEIGTLPSVKQLLAYLKMRHPDISVARIAMSAQSRGTEYAVDDDLPAKLHNPFAMAINGEHTVYVQLEQQ